MAATIIEPRPAVSLRRVLVAASAITAVSLGIRSTFGLFLTPVVDALHTDRAGFALAIAIQNLVWGIGQPVAGAVADRYGSARVLATGGVLYAVGVFGMSRATTTSQLYLSGGLVVGMALAAASFAVVLAAVGRLAPPQRRSWAMGVATAAGSFGQFVLVPAAGQLQDRYEWRGALAALGAVAIVVVAVAPLLRRSPSAGVQPDAQEPADVVSHGDGALPSVDAEPALVETLRPALRRALHHRPYLLLCAGFFVCGFHVTFIGTHLPAYLGDIGLSQTVGTRAIALIGLFNVAGAFGAGLLAERFARNRLLALIYALRAVAIVGLVVLPHTTVVALVFAAAMGVLWLSTVPLTSAIVVGQFGVTHAGSLFGVVFLAHQLGAFVGVWYGGRLADATGSYLPVWWIAVGLGVLAAAVNLLVDDRPAPLVPAPAERVAGLGAAGLASVLALGAVTAAVTADPERADAAVPYCAISHES